MRGKSSGCCWIVPEWWQSPSDVTTTHLGTLWPDLGADSPSQAQPRHIYKSTRHGLTRPEVPMEKPYWCIWPHMWALRDGTCQPWWAYNPPLPKLITTAGCDLASPDLAEALFGDKSHICMWRQVSLRYWVCFMLHVNALWRAQAGRPAVWIHCHARDPRKQASEASRS